MAMRSRAEHSSAQRPTIVRSPISETTMSSGEHERNTMDWENSQRRCPSHTALGDHPCGSTNCCSSRGDITKHDGVGAYFRVSADDDSAEYLCPRPDVYRSFQSRNTRDAASHTDRHLLKQQAVGAEFRIRVHNDAVGVRHHQAASNLTVQRNIATSQRRPKSVARGCGSPRQRCVNPSVTQQRLILSESSQHLTRRIPLERGTRFSPPVWHCG